MSPRMRVVLAAVAVTLCWDYIGQAAPDWHWLLDIDGGIRLYVAIGMLALLPIGCIGRAHELIEKANGEISDPRQVIRWSCALVASVLGPYVLLLGELRWLPRWLPDFEFISHHWFLRYPFTFLFVYVTLALGVWLGTLPFRILPV